jgi:hypothetical protein
MSGPDPKSAGDDPIDEREEESFPASDPPSSWQGPEEDQQKADEPGA